MSAWTFVPSQAMTRRLKSQFRAMNVLVRRRLAVAGGIPNINHEHHQ
jgi:hypothetical protein